MVERETADTSNSLEAIETASKLPLAKKRKITVIVIVSALLVILLLATLGTSRSSGKSHNIQGTYELSNVIYKDFDLGPQGTSYITVQNRNSNPLCTYYLRVDTLETSLSGYLSAGEAYSDCTRYKFWITSATGNASSDSMEWIYVYYYPTDDTVCIKSDISTFWYAK